MLFTLIATTGLRAAEALGAYVDDLDLTRDNEHLTVTGKGNRVRTVLLDDPALLALLRRHLKATGYNVNTGQCRLKAPPVVGLLVPPSCEGRCPFLAYLGGPRTTRSRSSRSGNGSTATSPHGSTSM